ncbi:lanC-like protein GCL1 [Chenopodium quinoa]|uniref:LanC-like protein GCL1 n=1 Tax=Chenopodium quinoa TaxID=63459 RepID=A0A803MCM2_CHEQI|nr:lanC-like protein GCL1 [Chenopodium quinoa]
MSPSIVECASDQGDHRQQREERNNQWLNSIVADDDRTATELSQFMFIPDDLTFLNAAIQLKNQVVEVMWKDKGRVEIQELNPTIYTGLMGTAFTCFRSFQATGSQQDLLLCADIVRACASLAHSSRLVTFLSGRGGIYALGAVIMNYMGDHQSCGHFLDMFIEVAQEKALPVGPEEGGFGMSCDLLCGRAGFLWAALFIKMHLGEEALPNDMLMPVVAAILAGGRAGASDNPLCPLMYRWHGTRYFGAAHGLAGILHVLLHFPLSGDDAEDVEKTLRYIMSKRFPMSGNYPSSDGNPRDNLVQWSHGGTSMVITLCKASQFREAGEVVWKSGLVKKVGLDDGVAGNAYAFLSLYKLTGEAIYAERAKAFGSFLYHKGSQLVNAENSGGTDHAFSLFLGLAGAACFFFDLLHPEKSKFPGYEL